MSSEKSDITQFFANQTILITGGTGVLGKVVIEKLLRECWDLKRIYMLMRPKKNKSTEERFEEFLKQKCFEHVKTKNLQEKIVIVDGDTSKPSLGLNPEDASVLKDETTCVLHLAANTNLEQTFKEAINIVSATRDIAELAKEMKQLKVLVHVSTAYSNCVHSHIKEEYYSPPMKSEDLLHIVECLDEDTLNKIAPSLLKKWPNWYVWAKCIAEDLVRRTNLEVPFAIVRPSIISNSVQEPFPGWADSIQGFNGVTVGLGLGILRNVPARKDVQVNLVPFDHVSHAVLAAAWRSQQKQLYGTIYNCVGFRLKTKFINGEIVKNIEKLTWKYPSKDAIWYPFYELRPNKYWYAICSFFLHTIPAYLIDFILLCLGKKPMAVKGYERIEKSLGTLSFFVKHQWKFDDDNIEQMWEEMDQESRKKFNFSFEDVDIDEYLDRSAYGMWNYLLKYTPDMMPQARKRLKILFVLHYIFIALFWFCVYKFSMFVVDTLL